MAPEEAATWQAWAGLIQAVGAIMALGAAVAVPFIQRWVENKSRVRVEVEYSYAKGPSISIGENQVYTPTFGSEIMINSPIYGDPILTICVYNDNSFPIDVFEVGVCEGKSWRNRIISVAGKDSSKNEYLEVKPFNRRNFGVQKEDEKEKFSPKTRAYITIGNGKVFFSKKGIWKDWRKVVR